MLHVNNALPDTQPLLQKEKGVILGGLRAGLFSVWIPSEYWIALGIVYFSTLSCLCRFGVGNFSRMQYALSAKPQLPADGYK